MEFPMHWVIILAVVVLLFGGKKIPEVMRGLGEGIRSFKEGMREQPNTTQMSNQAPPANTTPVITTATIAPDKK